MSKEWCVENHFLGYDELKEEGHPFSGVKLSELKFPEVEAVENITVGQARDLFVKGARIIPIKVQDNIEAAILPKKFLELVALKKLHNDDSALKTKTKDFVVVPDTLDASQLSKVVERHDAVIIEKRSEDKSKIEKLWAAAATDLFGLIK